jgi:hypothetical protein
MGVDNFLLQRLVERRSTTSQCSDSGKTGPTLASTSPHRTRMGVIAKIVPNILSPHLLVRTGAYHERFGHEIGK